MLIIKEKIKTQVEASLGINIYYPIQQTKETLFTKENDSVARKRDLKTTKMFFFSYCCYMDYGFDRSNKLWPTEKNEQEDELPPAYFAPTHFRTEGF